MWSLSLILGNLFLVEPIFKIASLSILRNEPKFRYRYLLKFQVLEEFNF